MGNRHNDRYIDNVYEYGRLRIRQQAYGTDRDEDYVVKCMLRKYGSGAAEINAFMEDMLDWTCARGLTLYECIGSPKVVDSRVASDEEIADKVREFCLKLEDVNHFICNADHLSDRRLYFLLRTAVLPEEVKFFINAKNPTYWNFCAYREEEDDFELDFSCLDVVEVKKFSHELRVCEEVWLTYYADDEQRRLWEKKRHTNAPAKRRALHKREYLTKPYVNFFY